MGALWFVDDLFDRKMARLLAISRQPVSIFACKSLALLIYVFGLVLVLNVWEILFFRIFAASVPDQSVLAAFNGQNLVALLTGYFADLGWVGLGLILALLARSPIVAIIATVIYPVVEMAVDFMLFPPAAKFLPFSLSLNLVSRFTFYEGSPLRAGSIASSLITHVTARGPELYFLPLGYVLVLLAGYLILFFTGSFFFYRSAARSRG